MPARRRSVPTAFMISIAAHLHEARRSSSSRGSIRSSMTARPDAVRASASAGSQSLAATGPVKGVESPAASASR